MSWYSFSLQVTLQPIETLLPERAVALEPAGHRLERHRVDLVQPLPADLRVDHQSRLAQDPEVLGNRWTARPEVGGQRTGVGGAGAQPVENRPAGRVGDRPVDVVAGQGSVHNV